MTYILIGLAALIAVVLLFLAADHLVKVRKKPQSVAAYLWNAAYFLQIRQYDKVLERLREMEADFALTPEEMCDACFKKADAYTGLSQPEQACEAYEQAYRCIRESDRPIKRNDALLEEIRACYQKCGRGTAFSKWEQLFVSLSAD